MEKAITIMGIVVAIIIVFIIIYLVGSFFGLFKFGSSQKADTQTETQTQVQTESDSESEEDDADKVTMIDVRGMTYDDAKDALNKVGLGIFKNGTQSSDDYAEGEIVSQDVEKGEKVDKNTTVKVVISSGKGSVPVPDVSGKSSDDATSKLEAEGFKVSTDYKYSDTVAQGKVVETAPSAGTPAEYDRYPAFRRLSSVRCGTRSAPVRCRHARLCRLPAQALPECRPPLRRASTF